MNFNLDPVHEEIERKIKLDTCVPIELIGIYYLRNGANPYLNVSENHLFDGDGMIHCIKFEKDHIIYSNKWIRTRRFKLEKKYKTPLFVRLGKLTTFEIFTKFITRLLKFEMSDDQGGEGTANTNVIYHAGKLLALNEMDKPYLLKITDHGILTVGRYDFNGKLNHNMNAHPKIDKETGELIALGYDVLLKQCYVSFINKNGILTNEITIPLFRSTVIHDLGITKSNVIILDLPLEFNLINVLKNAFPIGVTKKSRVGILNRKTHNLKWINLPHDEIIFHIAHSWEEENVAFCYNPETFDIQHLEYQRPYLKKIIISNNSILIKKVSKNPGELPIYDTDTESIYYSQISEKGFNAIVKHNIYSNKEDIVYFEEGLYGGEVAIYDKYLLNIIYCEKEKVSSIFIYNKYTLSLIKIIKLGVRIPFGFHGAAFCNTL